MTVTDVTSNNPLSQPLHLDDSFAAIDWHAPWLAHINGRKRIANAVAPHHASPNSLQSQALSANDDDKAVIADILNQVMSDSREMQADKKNAPFVTTPIDDSDPKPLRFVPQDALPEGIGYEAFIGRTGQIPTRDNLHDLFNGSMWLTFPETKALLNHYHMREIAAGNEGNKYAGRGRVRDTITVFDENGTVLVTKNPKIGEALQDFDWQNALVSTREQWEDISNPNPDASAAVYLFGHALIEQLIRPRKPLCAHSVVIEADADFFALSVSDRMAYLDIKLAKKMSALLSQDHVTPRQLSPLPVLGVPYFWEDNADPSFYDDSFVFRSGRRKSLSQ